MEPWFNEALQPRITRTGSTVALQFDEEAYELYMNRWKTKRVILEAVPHELAADPQNVRSYVQQVVEYYRKHGWLDRLVLNSPIDEPSSAQAFEETRKWAALVHEAAPGVHFLATKTPVPEHPAWGTLSGYVNDFSIHGNDLNDVRAEAGDGCRKLQKGRTYVVHLLRSGLSSTELFHRRARHGSRDGAMDHLAVWVAGHPLLGPEVLVADSGSMAEPDYVPVRLPVQRRPQSER